MKAKPTSILLYRGIDGQLRWIVRNHLTEQVIQVDSAHQAMSTARRWYDENEKTDTAGDRKKILRDLELLLMREEVEKTA